MASSDGEPNARTPLLSGSVTNLSTSGSCNVVHPSSTVLEPPNHRRSRWWSIRVMYITMFMSAITFTMTMPTIWPFLKVVDASATPGLLGYVVASYSAGQLLASPLFGSWSAMRNAREPLLMSMVLQVGSSTLYAYVQSIHNSNNGGTWLIAARVLMGFASGNAAVVRAYVSGATTMEERTGAMSFVSLFQSMGFILGPFLQTMLVAVQYPGPVEEQWLHFNMYTAPALISAVFTVINFVLILIVFRLHTVDDSSVMNITRNSEWGEEDEEGGGENVEDEETGERESERNVVEDKRRDRVAMGLTLFLFFITFFVFTIFETIGTPLTMDMYGWTKPQASRNMGLILGGAGLVSIGVFFAVIKMSRKGVDERRMLMGGFCFCFVGFFFLLPWGHDYPALYPAPINVITTPPNMADTSVLSTNSWTTANSSMFTTVASNTTTTASDVWENLTTMATVPVNWTTTAPPATEAQQGGDTTSVVTTVAPRGCPWYFGWCRKVPKIQLWQMLVGTLFIAVGYATCNCMVYTIYSKVLGPGAQGIWMGVITAFGSLSRMLGPVFVAQIYDHSGPRVTFASTSGVILITILIFAIGWRRLLPFDKSPYRTKPNEESGGQGSGGLTPSLINGSLQ